MPGRLHSIISTIRNPHGIEPADVRQCQLDLCDIISNPIIKDALIYYSRRRFSFAEYTALKHSKKRNGSEFTREEVSAAFEDAREISDLFRLFGE